MAVTSILDSSPADLIFYFALLGASAASIKHYFYPSSALRPLTPIAFLKKDGNSKEKDLPLGKAGIWWGGYSFGIMNAGVASVGLYGLIRNSQPVKEAALLCTAILFTLFSLTWFLKGGIDNTGNPNSKKQGLKVGLFGLLFWFGFYWMVTS